LKNGLSKLTFSESDIALELAANAIREKTIIITIEGKKAKKVEQLIGSKLRGMGYEVEVTNEKAEKTLIKATTKDE
jgi:hypothetical protein